MDMSMNMDAGTGMDKKIIYRDSYMLIETNIDLDIYMGTYIHTDITMDTGTDMGMHMETDVGMHMDTDVGMHMDMKKLHGHRYSYGQ
jgi:hypothetical protein